MSSSAKRPPAETVVLHFPFATRRARGAERCGARAPTQICVRCYLSIAFSCERRESDPRISMPSSTRRRMKASRQRIKGWVVRTHSRRRSHVETLKLNNSRYLRSSTSSFARFGVRRVASAIFSRPLLRSAGKREHPTSMRLMSRDENQSAPYHWSNCIPRGTARLRMNSRPTMVPFGAAFAEEDIRRTVVRHFVWSRI